MTLEVSPVPEGFGGVAICKYHLLLHIASFTAPGGQELEQDSKAGGATAGEGRCLHYSDVHYL